VIRVLGEATTNWCSNVMFAFRYSISTETTLQHKSKPPSHCRSGSLHTDDAGRPPDDNHKDHSMPPSVPSL
jgi:hypothetical protein